MISLIISNSQSRIPDANEKIFYSGLVLVIGRNSSEFGIRDVVETPGLGTRVRVLSMNAGQRILTENGSISTHEAEMSSFDKGADVVCDGQADVEYLRK